MPKNISSKQSAQEQRAEQAEQEFLTSLAAMPIEVLKIKRVIIELETPEVSLLHREMHEWIETMFTQALTPRELKIARLRFFEEETLEEIGKTFRITRERVRFYEGKIYRKIRRFLLQTGQRKNPFT